MLSGTYGVCVVTPYTCAMDALVICIGNKARGDDGVARLVAELLEDVLPQTCGLISEPQLDIVMAEDLADAELVVFVDAERREWPEVKVAEVEPTVASSHAHAVDPGGLLALAQTLYAAHPNTLLVSVAGPDMDHGEGLSETARAASLEAARTVLDLVARYV